jgi:hypothetical protein
MHGRGIQPRLERRACQPQVPTLTEVNAPGALRETPLDPGPQRLLDGEISRLLPLACGLDGLMVRLRSDGELA